MDMPNLSTGNLFWSPRTWLFSTAPLFVVGELTVKYAATKQGPVLRPLNMPTQVMI